MNIRNAIASVTATLQEVSDYFDNRSDVVDGDYGIPEANTEMSMLNEVEAALKRLADITRYIENLETKGVAA